MNNLFLAAAQNLANQRMQGANVSFDNVMFFVSLWHATRPVPLLTYQG